jgi:hypothetical protein
MGFLDGLGRMIAGKPVFEDGSQPKEQSNAGEPQAPVSSGLRDEKGYKIIPDIEVKNVRSRRDGDKLTVTAWVTNKSDQRIRIDYIYLLGEKKQINQELNSNQARELMLYQGSTPHDENERDAQIVYRLQENMDLFQNDYDVEFNRESDGAYTVEELHEDGSTRDI